MERERGREKEGEKERERETERDGERDRERERGREREREREIEREEEGGMESTSFCKGWTLFGCFWVQKMASHCYLFKVCQIGMNLSTLTSPSASVADTESCQKFLFFLFKSNKPR
jgi:hypothetical protein